MALETARPDAASSRRPHAATLGSTATRQWVLGALWVLAATAIQIARQRGVPAIDTLWAEDGQLFLSDALHDPVGSILVPAGGYLHLAPRLLAAFAAFLPLSWAPKAFAVGSALLVSLVSLLVFHASREVLGSWWTRAGLVAMVPLLPAAGFESLANAANVQYFLILGAFWALVFRPASPWSSGAAGGLAALAAMSSTINVILLPLAVWRLLRGQRYQRMVAIVFLGGLIVQAVTVFGAVILEMDPTLAQYPVQWASSVPLDVPRLFGLRVVGSALLGERLMIDVWLSWGWAVGYAGLALAGAVVGFAIVQARRGFAWGLVIAVHSLAFFALPVMIRGTAHLDLEGPAPLPNGDRYVIVPAMLLVAAILALLDAPGDRAAEGTRRWLLAGVLVVVTAAALLNFPAGPLRRYGPRWSVELAASRRACAAGSVSDDVEIPITPVLDPPAWFVRTHCGRLAA